MVLYSPVMIRRKKPRLLCYKDHNYLKHHPRINSKGFPHSLSPCYSHSNRFNINNLTKVTTPNSSTRKTQQQPLNQASTQSQHNGQLTRRPSKRFKRISRLSKNPLRIFKRNFRRLKRISRTYGTAQKRIDKGYNSPSRTII